MILLGLVSSVVLAEEFALKKGRPDYVFNTITEIEANDYVKSNFAFAQLLGWGTGTLQEIDSKTQFYWVAWTNSDALVQVRLSICSLDEGQRSEIQQIKDKLDRAWDYQQRVLDLLIYASNDWVDTYALEDHCWDEDAGLDEYVQIMEDRLSFIYAMTVIEYID